MIKNPIRKFTKTDLPDDVRAFMFMPWDDNSRLCRKYKVKQDIFLDLPESRYAAKTVRLIQIGKGHSTTAYQGDDQWVYLITKHDARDQAKDVLVDINQFAEDREFSKHYPYIEAVGFISKGNEDDYVYRMPYYRRVTASDKIAWHSAQILSKLLDEAWVYANYQARIQYRDLGFTDLSAKAYDCREKLAELVDTTRIPETLKEAVKFMAERLSDYEEGWCFEFPKRNLSVDEEGNLVLLDVIFNIIELDKLRKKAAKAAEAKYKIGY